MFGDKNKLKENAIRLLKSGVTQKYLLTNKSELKLYMMYVKTTNECRWIVNTKDIKENSYIIELITLENVIRETNNSMVHDLAAYKNLFSEVYNELTLEIDLHGQLIAVKNIEMLQQKWQKVRIALSKIVEEHPEAGEVITLNDSLFNNPENVKAIIGAMEFFELFFPGFYGKELPSNTYLMRNNRLKATPLKWFFSFSYSDPYEYHNRSVPLEINFEGKIAEKLTMESITEKYGKFEFITPENLKPDFKSDGKFYINRRSGMVDNAIYNHYEIIDKEFLYTINHYNLQSYE